MRRGAVRVAATSAVVDSPRAPPDRRSFYFYYKLQGENVVHQFFPTPEEFVGLSDMFRNEGPISFNTDRKYFVTGPEEVGEEEAAP